MSAVKHKWRRGNRLAALAFDTAGALRFGIVGIGRRRGSCPSVKIIRRNRTREPSFAGHRSAAIFGPGASWNSNCPEFLIYALEQRVVEANVGATDHESSTLNEYIETELVNLVTVRDVAELEITAPGFGAAVQNWLDQLRG